MVEFKNSRLADENYVSSVDDALVALERALTDYFGIHKNQEITALFAEITPDGKVISDLKFQGLWGVVLEAGVVLGGPANPPLAKFYVDTDGYLNIMDLDGNIVNRLNIDAGADQGWEQDNIPPYTVAEDGKALVVYDATGAGGELEIRWAEIHFDNITRLPLLDSGAEGQVLKLAGPLNGRYMIWGDADSPGGGDLPTYGPGQENYVLQVQGAGTYLGWRAVGVPSSGAGELGYVLTADGTGYFSWAPAAAAALPSYVSEEDAMIMYLYDKTDPDPQTAIKWAHWQQFRRIAAAKFALNQSTDPLTMAPTDLWGIEFTTTAKFLYPDDGSMSILGDTVTLGILQRDHTYMVSGSVSFYFAPTIDPIQDASLSTFSVELGGDGQLGTLSWIEGSKTNVYRQPNVANRITIPFHGIVKFASSGLTPTIRIVLKHVTSDPYVNIDVWNFDGSAFLERLVNHTL